MTADKFDLDGVIMEIGHFGKFQIINYLLISIPMGLTAAFTLAYVFEASDLSYRCQVTECDSYSNPIEFSPDWLEYAVPFDEGLPAQCDRYEPIENSLATNCSSDYYDRSKIKRCEVLVYETDEKNIVNEWDLTCSENKWKLTFVGTINTIGQLVALPIAGYVSDKYGRRFVLVYGMMFCGIFGLARSFAWNYPSFLAFEFLDPALGSGAFSAGYILGLELVGPKYRVFGGLVINSFYALGEALLGLVAMFCQNWRLMLQVLYGPAFLFLSYLWLVPESVRWLMTKGRLNEAATVLLRVARVNKRTLSPELQNTLDNMKNNSQDITNIEKTEEETDKAHHNTIWQALRTRMILLRVINCSFCWAANTFVYYGLSIVSVSIGSDKFQSFIYVSLIEIPGLALCLLMADRKRIGRVRTLAFSLLASGVACIALIFIESTSTANLIMFLFGKFAITIGFAILYTYTAELFPTSLRHSLFAVCSMFGRIGTILAPQAPLLEVVMTDLSLIVFGVVAFVSGVFTLFMPETLNAELPDTLEDALKIEEIRKAKKLKVEV